MSQPEFENIDLQELARYVVISRGTPEESSARQAYFRRIAAKVRAKGIELHKPDAQPKHSSSN